VWPGGHSRRVGHQRPAWDGDNYVTKTDVTGTTFGSETPSVAEQEPLQPAGADRQVGRVSDRLSIDGHVGYEKSTYKTPYDDKLYMRAKGNLIANYGADGQSASFQYPGWDATNPANYAMDSFYYRASTTSPSCARAC
jgi:iron complex outermembrane receptor protein